MKKFVCVFSFFLFSLAASASNFNQAVHSVNRFKGFSDSLKPYIEEILLDKGYRVIQDGYFFEKYGVPVDDLQIREDLLKPQTLILVSVGEISNNKDTMCLKSPDGTIFCSFSFRFYGVNEERELVEISRVRHEVREKIQLWNPEKKIIEKFANEVIERAKNKIPSWSELQNLSGTY